MKKTVARERRDGQSRNREADQGASGGAQMRGDGCLDFGSGDEEK